MSVQKKGWNLIECTTYVYITITIFYHDYIYIYITGSLNLVGRVFANDPGNLGLIPSRVIPKILKMVLDTSLLNTQQYKVRIKNEMEQSREWSSALPKTFVAIVMRAFWSNSITVSNFIFIYIYIYIYIYL